MLLDKLKQIINLSKSEAQAEQLLMDEVAKDNILKALEDTGVSIESLGVTLEDLNDNDFMHQVKDESENFAKSKTINLYRYVAHTSSGYGSGDLGSDSRSFCKVLVKRTQKSLMRYVDILKLNGSNKGFGLNGANVYNVFKWRGGARCKHVWVKYVYNITEGKLVKAPSSEQPNQVGGGDVPNA